MTNKTVTAVATINPAQLKDDKVSKVANSLGCSIDEATKLVDRLEKQQSYRKQYSQRPEVRAKRAAYSAARYAVIKQVNELLKQQ